MNKYQIIGIVSLILLALTILSLALMIFGITPLYGNPIITLVMLIAFSYTPYKTLYKKQPLTKVELVAFAIIFLLLVVLPLDLFILAK